MKKILFVLLFSSIAIFNLSCDAETLAALAGSVSGCMKPDAGNYNSGALIACTTECVGEQTGANCCCEEISYGCTETDAFNYNETATTECTSENSTCESGKTGANCCCQDVVEDCTNLDALNYNSAANTSCSDCCQFNTTTSGEVFGCTDDSACDYISAATLDCIQIAIEGAEIADRNTACCSYADNTTCYFDGNNNGYYESDTTLTTVVCDCGIELGGGWKNVYQVSNDIEVLGCLDPVCPEYSALANVDDGGCCTTDQAEWDTTSTMYPLLGAYEVSFSPGYMMNGECVADEMPGDEGYDDWGPDQDIMVLGYGGEFQHNMEFIHDMTSWEIWEYEVNPDDYSFDVDTMDGCEDVADEVGADYFMCMNFFSGEEDNNQGCWEIGDGTQCNQRPDCLWETKFCHFDFEGQGIPCHQLNEQQCNEDPGCKVGATGTDPSGNSWVECIDDHSFVDPWEECFDLEGEECTTNQNCELKEYGGEGDDEDDGPPWCLQDCPGFEGLKDCQDKDQQSCEADDKCNWDSSENGTDGSCGASIISKCGFVNGIELNQDFWCLDDCSNDVFEGFGEISNICMNCLDEENLQFEWNGNLEACVDAYSSDDGGGGDDGGQETWSECVPQNTHCYEFDSLTSCQNDTNADGINNCRWVEFIDWDGSTIQECEPNVTFTGEQGEHTPCNAMDEMSCKEVDNGCEWRIDPNPFGGSDGHCEPEIIHCEMYDDENTCENKDECFWNFPWEFEGQDGICHQIDHCAPFYNEQDCLNHYDDLGCEWEGGFMGGPTGCFTAVNNEYCDCALEIQDATTCTEAGGTWGAPDWAGPYDDFESCNVDIDEGMCYEMEEFQENDPCAEDLEAMGYNQEIDWDGSSCTITFTESEAGTWSVSTDGTELCLEFEDKDVTIINCADQTNEEDCYCGDCQWIPGGWGQPEQCLPNPDHGGRVMKKARMQYNAVLNRMITECGTAGNPGLPFDVDSDGNITIYIESEAEGWCEEVTLTKIQQGT